MKSFRERRAWLVGIISIVAIAAGVTGAFSINRFPALRGVYSISADLRDAAGLQPGNEVRVAGVKVGKVTKIELTPDAARVTMEVEEAVQLPMETRVEVKLRTLLGQKFIDLQFPRAFVTTASGGNDPSDTTEGFLAEGDVIPRSQTKIPFEIYQSANEGTAVLSGIDKKSLRRMIDVLATTVDTSKEELGRAVVALNEATDVLGPKSKDISQLLRNSEKVTKTLADGGRDLEGVLEHGSEVLGVLAERRETVS
ncbi:MAG: MCE family protein, partial [Actinomycetota bacterium]